MIVRKFRVNLKTSSERLLPRLSSGASPLPKDLPSAILLCCHGLLLCSPRSVCGCMILYVILQLLIGLTSLYFDWGFFYGDYIPEMKWRLPKRLLPPLLLLSLSQPRPECLLPERLFRAPRFKVRGWHARRGGRDRLPPCIISRFTISWACSLRQYWRVDPRKYLFTCEGSPCWSSSISSSCPLCDIRGDKISRKLYWIKPI